MTGERPILVTGATGFIGQALVRAIARTRTVSVLARDHDRASALFNAANVDIVELDDRPLVDIVGAIDPGTVYHLATQYEREDPADITAMIEANYSLTVRLLDAVSQMDGCHIVLAGSHFQVPGEGRQPVNLYAATKESAVAVARYLQDARGLRWIQVVLYDVYGPDDPRSKLIPWAVKAVGAREPIRLPSPEPLHHFVHIDDVVAGLIAASAMLEHKSCPSGRSVTLTSAHAMTPSEVVESIGAALGIAPVISPDVFPAGDRTIMVPRDGDRPDGWVPRVPFDEGVRTIIGAHA